MARPKKRSPRSQQKPRYRDLVSRGWERVAAGDAGAAERLFREAVQVAPKRGEGWHGLGVALYHMGRPTEAYEALRHAIALDPEVPEAWVHLAHVADHLGYTLEAHDAAREALRLAQALEYAPTIIEGIAAQVRALQRALERLAEEMGLPLDSNADRERLRTGYRYFLEGVAAAQAGDFARAAEAFRRSLEIAPDNPRAWGNLGMALLMLRDLDAAEEALRRALALKPDYTPAQANLQLLARLRDNPDVEVNAFVHGYTDIKHDAPKRATLR